MNSKKTIFLLMVFIGIVILSVSATYYRYFVLFDIETVYDDYGEKEMYDKETADIIEGDEFNSDSTETIGSQFLNQASPEINSDNY